MEITQDILQNKINVLETENNQLEQMILELEEHLKKYTASERSKKYYENHKDEMEIKNKEYVKKTKYKVNSETRKLQNK